MLREVADMVGGNGGAETTSAGPLKLVPSPDPPYLLVTDGDTRYENPSPHSLRGRVVSVENRFPLVLLQVLANPSLDPPLKLIGA